MQSNQNKQSWRNYQADLKRKNRAPIYRNLLFKLKDHLPVILILVFIPVLILAVFKFRETDPKITGITQIPSTKPKKADILNQFLNKNSLHKIMSETDLLNNSNREIEISYNNKVYIAQTSIDPDITRFVYKLIEREKKKKRGNPEDISIVILDPDKGSILSMLGYSAVYDDKNICLTARFPSASLFKIVTAAAAIEKKGYQPQTKLTFNGSKYTLYKSQLKSKKNRYTNTISFKNAFAQSVNPVFGKIGAVYLGKEALTEYAELLGFNSQISFDMKMGQSSVTLTDTPYQWAEIASGFNRETLISPLHAALLGSLAVNNGIMIEPSIIDKLTDDQNNTIYKSGTNQIHQAISTNTSSILKTMMNATVKSGTSRKAFKGYKRDKVLSKLYMGGKTGSIFNKKRTIKYDWFVGFAESNSQHKKLVVGIVVGHGKYIGLRAGYYAKTIFREYFKL